MIAICEDCYENLSSQGIYALHLCIRACESYSKNRFHSLDLEKSPLTGLQIDALEREGIILSTEISKTEIAFIPSCGPYINESGVHEYCWCRGENDL